MCPLQRSSRVGIPWTARIEFRLVRQHGTSDSDQPVGNAPESAGVTVAPGTQRGVFRLANGIPLYGCAGPVMDCMLQALVCGEPTFDDQAFA